ncbi:MAG: gamma-glutamyltransferase [Deltaproteobacteria bacterium]|nr:gamma-glutamyltransferase [Deltaproteobacteria bacterium]
MALAVWWLVGLAACAAPQVIAVPEMPRQNAAFHVQDGDTGRHFGVATAHPLATQAAAAALQRGGSAADALVAASLVLTVVTPQSTGIGGGGFAVVVPAAAPAQAVDFRETAPAATRRED